MSDFAADIQHWPTLAEFEAHLRAHPAAIAAWATEIVYHHTYRPLRHQWHGRKTMDGLKRYYEFDQGWPSGPHLFIAPDGIWQLTPLNLPGTHAMAGNADSWGIEVVGDYDHEEWPKPIAELALGAGAALLRWRGLPVNRQTVSPHHAYNPLKSCPGKEIDLDWVRRELARRLATLPNVTPTTGYSEHSPIIDAPQATEAHAIRYVLEHTRGGYKPWDIVQVIIPAYWEICLAVGVDPVLAIAQMIHETGCLSSALSQRKDKDGRDLRNPAGIGVSERKDLATPHHRPGCVWDADVGGYRPCVGFKDWATAAIPAHVGRLLAYATTPARRTTRQAALVKQALSYRGLDLVAHGSATTLKPLGAVHNPANAGLPKDKWRAGWAWDGQEYGRNIAKIANAIRSIQL
jgi:hypothetical protein